MNPSRRLGILGGMFDPIHDGHLDTVDAAQHALHLTALAIVPSKIPPHRPQPIASGFHRFAMVALAIAGRPGWRALDLELSKPAVSYTSDTLRHLHTIGFHQTELFFIVGADAFLEIATWKDYPALLDFAHFAVVARPGVPVAELPERLPPLASRMRSVDNAERRRNADTTVRLPPPRSARRRVSPKPSEGGKPDPTYDPDIWPEDTGERTFIFLLDETTADVSSTAIRQACLDHRTIAGMVPRSVEQHIEQHALYQDPTLTAGGDSSWPRAQAGRLHGKD